MQLSEGSLWIGPFAPLYVSKTSDVYACANDLEEIFAKHKHSICKSGSIGWLKIKNPKYSQAEGDTS